MVRDRDKHVQDLHAVWCGGTPKLHTSEGKESEDMMAIDWGAMPKTYQAQIEAQIAQQKAQMVKTREGSKYGKRAKSVSTW